MYRVVDLPHPVGPQMMMPPSGIGESRLVALQALLGEAERSERGRQRRGLQDADGDVLAVEAGDARQAQVHRLAARGLERRAAVLRQPAFGDVHVAHDLDAADDARLQLGRVLTQVVQHAVHATAHVQHVLARLDVYVRGLHAGRVADHLVDDLDDRGVEGQSRVFGPRLLVLLRHLAQLAAGAEVDRRRLVEPALRADHGHHTPLGAHAHLVDDDHVERVGHRQVQRAGVVEAHGKDAVPQDEVARQQPQRAGAGRRLRQVGDLEVQLAGEGVDERLLRDEAVAHQHLAQPASLVLLPGEDLIQLALGSRDRWRRAGRPP